jgi:hypothetical protein
LIKKEVRRLTDAGRGSATSVAFAMAMPHAGCIAPLPGD